MDERRIEKFIYREARLADEHRYQEWLSLWTQDAVYWVPCRPDDDVDPTREVSLVYDDRTRLEDRVAYLEKGTLDRDWKPRLRRVVSNIEIEGMSATEATVSSNFILVEARGNLQHVWCGRSIHRLREQGGELKIAAKKVLLVNNEQVMPSFQFLV